MSAEALFNADIKRRRVKIKKFEKKYGVKIQPRNSLEGIMRNLETFRERQLA